MAKDRIDMIKQLISNKGSVDMDIFKSYIPDNYAQIYTFYNILNECFISYKDITFDEPIASGDSFTMCFSLDKDKFKLLKNEINKKDGTFKYLRGHKFIVKLSGKPDTAKLIFTSK